MIPSWTKQYVGLAYTDYDCWELYRHIYKHEFDIILPKHNNYADPDDIEAVEANFNTSKNQWVKLKNPEPYCLIMMNIFGHPIHIGICLDNNVMLHTLKGHNSAIEKFTSIKWKNRIEGFYKWQSM